MLWWGIRANRGQSKGKRASFFLSRKQYVRAAGPATAHQPAQKAATCPSAVTVVVAVAAAHLILINRPRCANPHPAVKVAVVTARRLIYYLFHPALQIFHPR